MKSRTVFVWVRDIAWISILLGGLGYMAFDYFEDDDVPTYSGHLPENLKQFASLAARGPAHDDDCIRFGGTPDKMEVQTLRKTQNMEAVISGKHYPILVGEHALFVSYAWPNPEPNYTVMFCRFPR